MLAVKKNEFVVGFPDVRIESTREREADKKNCIILCKSVAAVILHLVANFTAKPLYSE